MLSILQISFLVRKERNRAILHSTLITSTGLSSTKLPKSLGLYIATLPGDRRMYSKIRASGNSLLFLLSCFSKESTQTCITLSSLQRSHTFCTRALVLFFVDSAALESDSRRAVPEKMFIQESNFRYYIQKVYLSRFSAVTSLWITIFYTAF